MMEAMEIILFFHQLLQLAAAVQEDTTGVLVFLAVLAGVAVAEALLELELLGRVIMEASVRLLHLLREVLEEVQGLQLQLLALLLRLV
jgi:hypothetical protein